MPLTYQAFLNSLLGSLGCERVAAPTRRRLAQVVMARWRFSGSPLTIEDVQDRHGSPLTALMQEFVRRAIETLANIHETDATFDKDLWNYSEIAHDIEEQRDVESDHCRRRKFDSDSYTELPEYDSSAL